MASRQKQFTALFLVLLSIGLVASAGISKKREPASGYLEGSYIVELEGKPVVANPGSIHASAVAVTHANFRANLKDVRGSLKVKNEYSRVFNGYALRGVSRKELEQIRGMPRVEAVYRNQIYSTTLDDVKPMIGVGGVWSETVSGANHTGKGVTVAVIDTGVDYTHPALGGCTTSEFTGGSCEKVVGGYDFVNGDNDPMDNNGHGTHVAGIVAANGTLKGVAPGAKLLAYKVLNSEGVGYTSDIISGIEQAVMDGADIISLSLGGDGNPDDPLSDAVANAVANGTVAVVAAGNAGTYYSIASPGVEQTAITVGAVDKDGTIASYSSRGPVTWDGTMILKPDVVAPGSRVCSTSLGSGDGCAAGDYTKKSGTSMAAPVVSGAAALILQSHPSWTPQDVKSALVTTATELGYGEFTAGSGLVNVSRADDTVILTEPAVMDFGNLSDRLEAVKILEIQNNGTSTLQVNLSASLAEDLSGDTDDAVKFNDSSLLLEPGSTAPVKVSINATALSGTFSGEIVLESNSSRKSLSLPYSFTRVRYKPLIASTEPASQIAVEAEELTVNLTAAPYPEKTTATVTVDGEVYTLWEQKDVREGSVQVPLAPGNNTLYFSLAESSGSSGTDRETAYVYYNSTQPSVDAVAANLSSLEPDTSFRVEADLSDRYGLDRAAVFMNSTGTWKRYAEKGLGGNLTANVSFNLSAPEFSDQLFYRVKVTDQVGNSDTAVEMLEENRPPVLRNYSLRNRSFVETSVLSQDSKAIFTVEVTDPENNTAEVKLVYEGPSKTVEKQMENITSGFQVNVTTGSSGVEGTVTVRAVDRLGDNASIERGFRVEELKPPSVTVSSPDWREALVNTSIFFNASVSDNYNLSSVTLAANSTGSWQNLTTRSKYGINASVSFLENGISSPMDLYWRIWVKDSFGNLAVSSPQKIEVVEFNPDTTGSYARKELELVVQQPATIRINRSDLSWSHTFHARESWAALGPVYSQGFEADSLSAAVGSNWSTSGDRAWSLATISYSGAKSAVTGNISADQVSYLNFSYMAQRDRVLKFYYRVLPDGHLVFQANGKDVLTDYMATGWSRETYLMESGHVYNFSWRYSGGPEVGGSVYLDNLSIGRPEPAGYTGFIPQNYGEYTLTIYQNRSGSIYGKHVETFLAEVSAPPQASLRAGFPMEGRKFDLELQLYGPGYDTSSARVYNSTGSWSLDGNITATTTTSTYGPTGEPVRNTSLDLDVPSLDSGTYNLSVNITGKSGGVNTFNESFRVFPAYNLTMNVTNGTAPVTRFLSVGPSSGEAFLFGWEVKGTASRPVPDLSGVPASYTLQVLNQPLDAGAFHTVWLYRNISMNYSDLETYYTRETADFSDRNLVVKSVQHYPSPLHGFRGLYNTSKLGIEPGDYTLYRCTEHLLNGSCESGWKQARIANRSLKDEVLELATYEAAEAYALGRPVTEENPGSTTPAPSFGGGFAPTPEVVVEADNDSVRVENLYLENESLRLSVPENGLGIESVNFSGTVENGSAVFQALQMDREELEVFQALRLDTPVAVRTEFSYPSAWLERNNFSRGEMGIYAPERKVSADLSATLSSGRYVLAAPEHDVMVAAANSRTDTCRTMERDDVSGNWSRVESCEVWRKKNTAEKMIETVEEKVSSGKAQHLLRRAKQEYRQGNYSAAIEKAQQANQVQKRQEDAYLGPVMLAALAGFILVLALAGFYGFHVLRKKRLRRELSETTELVRKGMETGALPRDPGIGKMIQEAEQAISASNYEEANAVLERLRDRL
ncbi:MAG: S8 family serine peptidase [Candidatus Nanohaloarchaea archaeon]